MARAGRTTPRHVAADSRDTAATPDPDRRSPSRPVPVVAGKHKASHRRAARIAGPTVFALSLAGTVVAWQVSDDAEGRVEPTTAAVASVDFSLRTADVSRSISRAVTRAAARPPVTAKQVVLEPTAVDHEFATAMLNVRTGPSAETPRTRTVPRGARLAVTGQTSQGWAEVLVEREVPVEGRSGGETKAKQQATRTETVARWVNAEYLAERKPAPPEPEEAASEASSSTATSGISGASCPDGSSVESGLTSSAVRMYRAVCAAFPFLTSYGGYAPRGEHYDGRAIDFMVSDPVLGQAIADFLLANASALGVRDIIWAQRIWVPERASEGWRFMEDRGSPTANHYDHVHAAVY